MSTYNLCVRDNIEVIAFDKWKILSAEKVKKLNGLWQQGGGGRLSVFDDSMIMLCL